MVSEKAIGEGVWYRCDVFNKKIQKILVVLFFLKNVLLIITPVVDVVIISRYESF